METQTSSRTEEKSYLRYWLANEDWYPSQFTRRWLARTPHEKAMDTLAEIAEDAQPEPRQFWQVAAMVLANSGLATSTGIAGGGANARKAGTRAALLLAQHGDARAIAPLVRVFSMGGFLQSKYQAAIEEALTRFLGHAEANGDDEMTADVRVLAQRIWNARKGRGDLTDSQAELLRAALRYLYACSDEASKSLRQTIAASRVNGQNRRRLQAAVQG